MILATKTLELIDKALEADRGAAYRRNLWLAMEEMKDSDAFNPEEEKHPRKHLGMSSIGDACALHLWLLFRWAVWDRTEGRMLRLFNRGHLEEARWVALFRTAGITVHVKSEEGKQFRAHGYKGHFGGSMDGIGYGSPDIPGEWFLLEFKTANRNKFEQLIKKGVKEVYEKYYAQLQQYMSKQGLRVALFCSVSKEDDRLHLEVVQAEEYTPHHFNERARLIVDAVVPPPRIAAVGCNAICKWCDCREYCHGTLRALPTCRTCAHVVVGDGGQWLCQGKYPLTAEQQFAGCAHRIPMEGVK